MNHTKKSYKNYHCPCCKRKVAEGVINEMRITCPKCRKTVTISG